MLFSWAWSSPPKRRFLFGKNRFSCHFCAPYPQLLDKAENKQASILCVARCGQDFLGSQSPLTASEGLHSSRGSP